MQSPTTVALDTNIVSKILRGEHADIEQTLDRIQTCYIPWAVYGELMAGMKAGANPDKYIPVLESFLAQPFVLLSSVRATDVMPFYAEIYAALKRQGTSVYPNDLWIAAECAQQGLPLFTLDKDFEAIPQILRFV